MNTKLAVVLSILIAFATDVNAYSKTISDTGSVHVYTHAESSKTTFTQNGNRVSFEVGTDGESDVHFRAASSGPPVALQIRTGGQIVGGLSESGSFPQVVNESIALRVHANHTIQHEQVTHFHKGAKIGTTSDSNAQIPTLKHYMFRSEVKEFSGPWAAQNVSVRFTRMGRLVSLQSKAFQMPATSSSLIYASADNTMEVFRPTRETSFVIPVVDDSTFYSGILTVKQDGSLVIGKGASGPFSATGNVGFGSWDIRYTLVE